MPLPIAIWLFWSSILGWPDLTTPGSPEAKKD